MTHHSLTLSLAILLAWVLTVHAFGNQPVPEKVDFTTRFWTVLHEKNVEKNLVASPFGVSRIGEMLYWGAAGETRNVLENLFQPTDDDAAATNQDDTDERPYISADGIWYQKDFPFLPTYIEKIRARFEAEIVPADFAEQAPKECAAINAWAARATNERIVKLFEQLDSQTRLVLVNAICFQGRWASPFVISRTTSADFHVSAEKNVTASFMHQTNRFQYGENETCQYLEMPYEKNRCSMLIVLPRSGHTLRTVEGSLRTPEIDRLRSTMTLERVEIRLPKFRFENDVDLKTILTDLGAGVIFDAKTANFAGMDGSGKLVVDQALQKVFVQVDETGTEAAAATGVSVGLKSAPIRGEAPKTFHADRPFFFLIRDNVTGVPLFVGHVVDPS